MSEKTKQNKENKKTPKKNRAETITEKDPAEKEILSDFQKEKSYYYDDSYGYEIYNPDEDDDED